MPRAILVSGPINAGKTTVSRLLSERLARAAVVSGDALRACVAWMPLEESLPLTLENLAHVSRTFLAAGLHVVVDYPLRAADHARLARELRPLASSVHAFVLAPPLHVALRDRGGRRLEAWERARIRALYDQGIHDPGFGIPIDNAELTPEETVEEILSHLRRERGRA